MTQTLSPSIVEKALEEGKTVDRSARITALEKQLAKVRKDITEQERLEKRYALVKSAYSKLCKELGKSLTREEYNAIDGIYLFLHGGCVDMVRHIPSATSGGEGKKLIKDLDTAEAMKELASLTK